MKLFHPIAFCLIGASAQAATYTQITDPGLISAGAVTETFEGYALGTGLPLVSGSMTLSGPSTQTVTGTGYDHPGTPSGSRWVGSTADADSYGFAFSTGISQFGLVMYGHQFAGTTMELFDEATQSLGSFSVAIAGGTAGQYVGFLSDMDDVRSVQITFGAVDAVWIDNVSYLEGVSSTVPLPATLPLLLVALGGAGLAARRRKS